MFKERLDLDLSLKIGSLTAAVPGAHIKRFRVDATSYGFVAEVEFWTHLEIETDTLWPQFKTQELIQATLKITGYDNQPDISPRPMLLKGLVTHKSVHERVNEHVEGEPILFRRYRMTFADAASVLWRQHRPTALYAEATMAEILSAHSAPGITLDLDWPEVFDAVRPLVCLELGKNPDGASFYDFLHWYLERENGSLVYDSFQNKYTISKSKPEAPLPSLMNSLEVEKLDVVFPEALRWTLKVMNALAESPTTEEATQDQKIDGIRHEFVAREAVPAAATAIKTIESERLAAVDHEVGIAFKIFPTVTFCPGTTCTFDAYHGGFHLTKIYRCRELTISGYALDPRPEADRGMPAIGYDVRMHATLELSGDVRNRRPAYQAPVYPVTVQGRVVSEIGEDGDKTYQIYQDADTSLDVYKVLVPAWNAVVPVPFEPLMMPGHFYLPAYREQPVVVSLWLDRGEIHRFLDWGAGTRLPLDGQGDHLLLGKRRTSQTSISHTYVDAKPVLEIARQNAVDDETLDQQIVRVEEGCITITVGEVEDSEAASEKFSVKPRVDAAQAELAGETESAMVGMSATYQMAQAGVAGELGTAMAETQQALDDMDSEISGKIDEVRGEAEAALSEISGATAELQLEAEDAANELENLI